MDPIFHSFERIATIGYAAIDTVKPSDLSSYLILSSFHAHEADFNFIQLNNFVVKEHDYSCLELPTSQVHESCNLDSDSSNSSLISSVLKLIIHCFSLPLIN